MARIITVDFTGVDTGSKFVRVPASDYGLKLTAIKEKKGEESGKPYLMATFEITAGNKRGLKKSLGHNFSLQKQSVWNFRNFIEACGKPTPAKALKIDLDKLIGLECAGTVMDDQPYEGKIKSIISAFFPLDDLNNTSETGEELEDAFGEETEGEEEEELETKPDAKKGKKTAKKKPAAEEVEETEEEEEAEELFS